MPSVQKLSPKVESPLISQSDRGSMMQAEADELKEPAPNDAAALIEKDPEYGGKGRNEGRRKKIVVVGLGMVGIAFM